MRLIRRDEIKSINSVIEAMVDNPVNSGRTAALRLAAWTFSWSKRTTTIESGASVSESSCLTKFRTIQDRLAIDMVAKSVTA